MQGITSIVSYFKTLIKYNFVLVALLLLSNNGWGQTTTRFNDGYLSLFKVTSGASLNNTATGIVLEEYVNTGTGQSSTNFSVSMPTSGTNTVLVSGTASSAGAITRSDNGRYVVVPGYNATLGAANTTFTTNSTLRLINATGAVIAGVQGGASSTTTFYGNGNNNLRGGFSDDGTTFWGVGNGTGSSGANGLQTCSFSSGVITGITNVTASQNLRVGKIINGQIFVSTASTFGTVGIGKPTAAASTFTNLFTLHTGNTSVYSFDVSPDFLTVYISDDGASKGIYRYTYSGTYSGGTWSGGSWSGGSLITSISGCTGLTVDWSGYSFNASSANGAKLYYCIPLILYTANDNGTAAVTSTTLRTISGFNAFRGLAFSPIKQTISKGANTPATGNITKGSSNTVLFQMNLSADEGNSTIKKVVLATSGTAVLVSDISNFRLLDDINNNGVADASEIFAPLSTGTVSGSNITFSSISLSSYIAQGSSKNFLIIGDVAANATAASTFTPSIASNNTINNIAYTSNLTNAGGSLVTMGTSTNAPTGNTLTIVASSSTVTFNANGGSGNMANQTSSAAANLTSNSFTRTCYAFTGWNTAANGTGTAYADGANYPFTSSTTLYAQWTSQNQWTGSANNNWNNAGNWSCGNVPSATENVLINTGSPALDINYEVPTSYTLTLSGTGTLTINPGNKLTITGAADFGNKLVTVAANASNTGAIVLNGGSLQNATNVALQQWFTGQRAWRMLSNPFTTSITGSSIASDNSGFSVNQSGTGDMVVYNSGTDAWSANTTIAANTCYGFFFKGLQSDFNGTPGLSNYSGAGPTASVYSVKGTLNTGSVSITPSNASPNYTLVGNPFVAPVNSIALTGGAAAPYYYYQANAASTDSKVKSGAWIAASSNSSNTTTIPMMSLIAYQAPSTSSFTIPIAAINTANTAVSALFKTTAAATQLNIDLMKNNILFDRCIVREDIDVLAQSLDQKDLLKMENVTANVYALTPANDRLAVYTEPAFTQAIPLAISAPVGTYLFNIQNTMNTSADWYLIDNYTHQQQLLANNSTYTFDITNDAASKGSQRFELSKQAWTTSVGTASNQDPIQLLGNLVQDHIAVQLDANIRQASYQLLDIRGAVLAQGTLMAGKQEIAMASFVSGMYLLHIQNDQQHSVYKITKY